MAQRTNSASVIGESKRESKRDNAPPPPPVARGHDDDDHETAPLMRRVAPSSGKTIHFVRHAESKHNHFLKQCDTWMLCQCWCWYNRKEMVDAGLSEKGKVQVRELKKTIVPLLSKVDLVIVSPLSRAIETASVFRENPQIPYLVAAEAREARHNSCDDGTPASILRDRYPWLNFDKLDEIWWYQPPPEGETIIREPDREVSIRCNKLLRLLHSQSAMNIAVVAHQNFINQLTGKSLKNCEIVSVPIEDLKEIDLSGCFGRT